MSSVQPQPLLIYTMQAVTQIFNQNDLAMGTHSMAQVKDFRD